MVSIAVSEREFPHPAAKSVTYKVYVPTAVIPVLKLFPVPIMLMSVASLYHCGFAPEDVRTEEPP